MSTAATSVHVTAGAEQRYRFPPAAGCSYTSRSCSTLKKLGGDAQISRHDSRAWPHLDVGLGDVQDVDDGHGVAAELGSSRQPLEHPACASKSAHQPLKTPLLIRLSTPSF